ncbi:MAG TPA: CehA/McbA family metallohydrolase, partial [Longimicrobiales bacterium]|nr:CehA/McbA family metallohydrolase [Longimicrobiales bacterium]
RDGRFGEAMEVARGPMAYRPRVAVGADGAVWVTWSGRAGGAPAVLARRYRGDAPDRPVRVSRAGEGWHPAIAVDEAGTAWLAWEERAGSRWRVMAAAVAGDDVARAPFAVSESDGNQMRPALVADDDGVWLAFDEYRGDYDYDVALRRIDRDERAAYVTAGPALEQAAALAPAPGPGVWVAWHSNRSDGGGTGVPRWIELRRWDGRVLAYPPPMPDRDLAARESIQSFEFPTLLADGERVWVFGRPSQGFYAQVLSGEAWTRLTPFGLEGWGGRGQVVPAVRGPDGAAWTVRRDIGAILLQRLALEEAGVAGAAGTPAGAADAHGEAAHTADTPAGAAGHAHPGDAGSHSHGTGPGQHTHGPTRPLARADATAAGGSGVEVDGYRLFFGDIHQHSSLSDGMGTVEDTYTRSRDRYGLDFAALADHEWFVRNRLLPSEWAYIQAVNASFHDPGTFVSIPAYEWTGRRYPLGPGHKNVYFPDEGRPIYSLTDTLFDETPELFAQLKRDGAVAVPHHIGWTGTDWEHHDPVAQPEVEIVSVHGAFEHMGNEPIVHRGGTPGMFVQDGWARGLRFGVLGSSDGHGLAWHHGVGRKEDPWQQGLTGVWAPELTREAVFEALKARRVYATSGAPIRLWLEARGGEGAAVEEAPRAEMGGELSVSGPPTLESRVVGTARVRYVYLLRDNAVIHSYGGDADGGRYGSFTFVDEDVAPGTHWYYLRVVQEDGEVAWSSPIWVTVAGEGR